MMESFIVKNESEIPHLALELREWIVAQKNILFYGEMGAGKTTLIKGICAALGSSNEISSPTYALVNEYEGDNSLIYHFDLFRLKSFKEVLDIGFEEYIDSDAICLIEWPEKIESLVEHGLKIEIDKIDFNTRKISIFKF
jgi:tRNA threonylcarbamoyladenosine biosynthesis protein TsaE